MIRTGPAALAGLAQARGKLDAMRQVAILGSTGSIGTQALDVVRRNPDRFRVVALSAAGMNQELFVGQIREFLPPLVAIADEAAARDIQDHLGSLQGVEYLVGPEAAERSQARPIATWCSTRSSAAPVSDRRSPRCRRARRSPWPTRSRWSSAASS